MIRHSSREVEVLHRISLGASKKEMVREMELSPNTARTFVENILLNPKGVLDGADECRPSKKRSIA